MPTAQLGNYTLSHTQTVYATKRTRIPFKTSGASTPPKAYAPKTNMPSQGHSSRDKPKRTQAHSVQTLTDDDNKIEPQARPDPQQDTVVLHHSHVGSEDHGPVSLLIGCAQVLDTVHTGRREVKILFDGGADRSFITKTLAQELGLDIPTTRTLTMYTFGYRKPKAAKCSFTTLTYRI